MCPGEISPLLLRGGVILGIALTPWCLGLLAMGAKQKGGSKPKGNQAEEVEETLQAVVCADRIRRAGLAWSFLFNCRCYDILELWLIFLVVL